MKDTHDRLRAGFTLIEVLLVVAGAAPGYYTDYRIMGHPDLGAVNNSVVESQLERNE